MTVSSSERCPETLVDESADAALTSRQAACAPPPGEPRSTTSELAVLDYQQLLDRCMGQLDFAERLLGKFEARFPGEVDQLLRGWAARDASCVARVAHQLKGASANVGAGRISRVASEIEEAGRLGLLDDVERQLRELEGEWAVFLTSSNQARRGDMAASPDAGLKANGKPAASRGPTN